MLQKLFRDYKYSAGIFDSKPGEVFGILAEFSDPGALYHAAREVRRSGYRHFDVHSPFPIHGMDRAMGLGNSRVGIAALIGGTIGLLTGLWMQWWMNGVDYPVVASGKPLFAIEPSIPVIFELTILIAAFGAVIGMLTLNGLPRPYNPVFYSDRFAHATDDAFFLHISSSDEQFDQDQTMELLNKLGATHVESIEDHGTVQHD